MIGFVAHCTSNVLCRHHNDVAPHGPTTPTHHLRLTHVALTHQTTPCTSAPTLSIHAPATHLPVRTPALPVCPPALPIRPCPIHAALFEWDDGPLIHAMQTGNIFLLDEIFLADNSVLECLNSILQPAHNIVLAECRGFDVNHVQITADLGFKLLATMNPGGDYGQKELSPALQNRFTKIWVSQVEVQLDQ